MRQVRGRLTELEADPAYAREIVNVGYGIAGAKLAEAMAAHPEIEQTFLEFMTGGLGYKAVSQMQRLGAKMMRDSKNSQAEKVRGNTDNEYVKYVTGLTRDGRLLAQGASAQADAPAVSAGQAGQAGDGSSQPTDATGTARAMLERACPQAGQQAQVEQTSVQGQAADGQIQGMQPIAAYAQSYDWQTAQEFQDYYQPEISPAEYAAGFAAVYNAARQGLSRQVGYRQTTVLTEKQRRVAFKAGQQANIRRAQRPGAEQMQQYQARLVNGIRQAAQDVSAQVIDPGYKSTERINDKSGLNGVAVSSYIRRRRRLTGSRSP